MKRKPLRRSQLRHTRRHAVSMVETALVLSAALLLILACIDLTILLVRRNALCEGARHAARFLVVRGSEAEDLGILGPSLLDATLDTKEALCDEIRPLLPTMSPAEVRLNAEWLDGDNQIDQRVRVTLQYTHRPLFAILPNYGMCLLLGSSTVRIGH